MSVVGPCKNCTERKEGCHDKCAPYISWKEEVIAAKEWCKKENSIVFSKAGYGYLKKRYGGAFN